MKAATAILVVVPDLRGPIEAYKIPIMVRRSTSESSGLRVVEIEVFVQAATRLALAAQERRVFPRDREAATEMDAAIGHWRQVVMGLES